MPSWRSLKLDKVWKLTVCPTSLHFLRRVLLDPLACIRDTSTRSSTSSTTTSTSSRSFHTNRICSSFADNPTTSGNSSNSQRLKMKISKSEEHEVQRSLTVLELNISINDCTTSMVRSRYLALVKQYHPDSTSSPTSESTSKFLDIQKAYHHLTVGLLQQQSGQQIF